MINTGVLFVYECVYIPGMIVSVILCISVHSVQRRDSQRKAFFNQQTNVPRQTQL